MAPSYRACRAVGYTEKAPCYSLKCTVVLRTPGINLKSSGNEPIEHITAWQWTWGYGCVRRVDDGCGWGEYVLARCSGQCSAGRPLDFFTPTGILASTNRKDLRGGRTNQIPGKRAEAPETFGSSASSPACCGKSARRCLHRRASDSRPPPGNCHESRLACRFVLAGARRPTNHYLHAGLVGRYCGGAGVDEKKSAGDPHCRV